MSTLKTQIFNTALAFSLVFLGASLQAQTDSIYLAQIWKGGKVGFVKPNGELHIPIKWDAANTGFAEGVLGVNVGRNYDEERDTFYQGRWGYIDLNGKLLQEIDYETCQPFEQGWGRVQKGEKWNYVNRAGDYLLADWVDEARDFSEDLAAVKVGEAWGFVNQMGEMVIKPRFSGVSGYVNGLSSASELNDNRFGYINQEGNYVIDPDFDVISLFDHGVAVVGQGTTSYLDGDDYESFEGKYGLINREGEILLSFEYEALNPLAEWGGTYEKKYDYSSQSWRGIYSNTQGLETPAAFKEVSQKGKYLVFNVPQLRPEGVHENFEQTELDALVEKFYRELLKGDENRQQVLLQSDFWYELQAVSEGEYSWMTGTLRGLIDQEGKLLFPPAYDNLRVLSEELLIVGEITDYGEAMFGVMKLNGDWLIEPAYTKLNATETNWLTAQNSAGQWGAIDREGRERIPFEYVTVDYLGEGYWHLQTNYEDSGMLIHEDAPFEFIALPEDCGITYSSTVQQGCLIVMDSYFEYYGLLDLKGNWILRPEYESIDRFRAVALPIK